MEIYTSEQAMGVEDRQEWRRIYLLVLSNLLVFMDRDVNFKIYNIRMYGTYASTALTHTRTHTHTCYQPDEALTGVSLK